MTKPIELDKIPFNADAPAPTERELLPYSTTPISGLAARRVVAKADATEEFVGYLNQQKILKMPRHKSSTFDPAAEILRDSVYKTIELKPKR
jgi:hypothetical protein